MRPDAAAWTSGESEYQTGNILRATKMPTAGKTAYPPGDHRVGHASDDRKLIHQHGPGMPGDDSPLAHGAGIAVAGLADLVFLAGA